MRKNLFGYIFFGVIAVAVASNLISMVYGHVRSIGWVEATAMILSIEKSAKSAKARYSYTYEGVEYQGDKFAFLSNGSITDKYIILSEYQTGETVSVFVNPSRPKESVMVKRSFSLGYVWVHLFVIMMTLIMGLHIGSSYKEA